MRGVIDLPPGTYRLQTDDVFAGPPPLAVTVQEPAIPEPTPTNTPPTAANPAMWTPPDVFPIADVVLVQGPPADDAGADDVYGFAILGPDGPDGADGAFRVGPQLVEIRNESWQAHTMAIYPRSAFPGTGPLTDVPAADLDAWLWRMSRREAIATPSAGEAPGPFPPPVAYAAYQSGGVTTWLEVSLSAGNYVIVCLVADIYAGNTLHAVEGMVNEITVQ